MSFIAKVIKRLINMRRILLRYIIISPWFHFVFDWFSSLVWFHSLIIKSSRIGISSRNYRIYWLLCHSCRVVSCAATGIPSQLCPTSLKSSWLPDYSLHQVYETHRHSQTLTDTHRHSQTLTDTHRHSQTLTDTRRHSQTLITDTHRHSQTLTDTHRHSQTLTDTHRHSQTLADTHRH